MRAYTGVTLRCEVASKATGRVLAGKDGFGIPVFMLNDTFDREV